MIRYKDYLKILNDKNIMLYDHQKRISYYNLNNMFKNKNNIQHGGSRMNLNDLQDFQIEKLVFKLLNNEYDNVIEMINKYNI
jgi:hypothetical protein